MLLLACQRLAPQQRRARCTATRRCSAPRRPAPAAASPSPLRLPLRPRLAPPPLRAAAAEAPEPPPTPELPPPRRTTPGLAEANVSYCLGCLWLLFLTDLSGIGPVLLRSDNVALSLAALQWVRGRRRSSAGQRVSHAKPRRPDSPLRALQGGFVTPVLAHSASAGFDLRATFAARGCSARAVASGAAGGACLWVLLSAATALRGGVSPDGAEASFRLVEGAATLFAAPADARGWAELLGLGALAPAAGEELLFRGYLLTALRSRLGRIDAVRTPPQRPSNSGALLSFDRIRCVWNDVCGLRRCALRGRLRSPRCCSRAST